MATIAVILENTKISITQFILHIYLKFGVIWAENGPQKYFKQ